MTSDEPFRASESAVRFDRRRGALYREAMKIRASIAVDRALLKKADQLSRRFRSRSEFVEAALRAYVARLSRQEKQARDLEVINRRAEDLNQEALDVLDYQDAL